MNTRLVWNFEMAPTPKLNLQNLQEERENLRWEARYFWHSQAIISLHGLDHRFLSLSNYALKHRCDSYLLLPDMHFNIKRRRMQLFYKPLLTESEGLQGYGKKINLLDYPAHEILPGTQALTASALLARLEKSKEIAVDKDALIYSFPSVPTIKLELARLSFAEQIFFSACIEGKSKTLVSSIAKHLLKDQVSCDYVNFLKHNLADDQ